MRFYKIIQNGFLECVGQGLDGEEITEQEYNDLLAIIELANTPLPPESAPIYACSAIFMPRL